MKRNIHIIVVALALFVAMPAAAQNDGSDKDYDYMTVRTTNEDIQFVKAKIQKITFAKGKVQVYSSEGMREFDQIDLKMLIFSNALIDAIEEIDASPEGVTFKDATLSNLNAPEGTPVYIYSISGLLFTTSKVNRNSVSLSNLPKATYIVKVGKKAYKIQVR